MKQDDIPKVDSVNLSTRADEVDWRQTILSLATRQGVDSEGQVKVPVLGYKQLIYGLEYVICQYVHQN